MALSDEQIRELAEDGLFFGSIYEITHAIEAEVRKQNESGPTASKEASMALSDDQIVNIWGREPRYHAAPIGSTDIAFARAIEAEVRKQDEALILQLVEALTVSLPQTDRDYGWKPEDWTKRRADALAAGRARLGGTP